MTILPKEINDNICELCEIDYASKPIQNFNNIGFGNQN